MGRPSNSNRSPTRAFTLVEMAVVITLIGVLAAIAIPAYRHIALRSKAAAVINDIRTFSTTFITYNTQNGHWPASPGTPGQIPIEVQDAVSAPFALPTPIGGYYNWENDDTSNGFHVTAAISIVSTGTSTMSDDLDLLQMINDLMESDGDLNSGSVRLGSTNNLVFIIEQ